MCIGAKEVKVLADYRLLVVFENEERRIFDVSTYLNHGVFRDLKDPAMFKSVHISFDSVAWSNGADLCSEVLYEKGASPRSASH